MNSDRGDFRFSGLVRQPLYVSCGAVSEQANIRKGRAYRMIRAKAAGCARANFALRANGTHRDGEGASGELYGRSCGARGRLTSGAVPRGRFVAGAGMPPPAARGGDMPGRAENPSDGRKSAADRICGHRNPARAIGKAVPPDEFSDIRRRRERRRCVPAKPTGQAPRGRFVAGAGMPPAARGGDMPGRAESPSGARKRAAGREHSTAERISGRRNPARAIGKAAPRMNFPTSGEGGREDDASRQSRPDKLRTGGSLPEPECPAARGGDIAGACRKSVRRAKEGRGAGVFRCGTHLRTPQSRTGDRKGGAPDEFSDIRRRRERRRCVPAKPIGQAPRGRFVAGAGMHPAARGGDIAGACRKSVGRAKEGRGPHLRTPQSRTGGRKGGAPDEFSDIRRRRERRRCVPAKPTGQAPRGQRTGGLECKL
ncbi:hypothetical protein BN3659_01866 [Alistipes sp. CHKCI003]|nr:hypothetical protein BN3659_01866 [Alistipes sp. CHKCI003]